MSSKFTRCPRSMRTPALGCVPIGKELGGVEKSRPITMLEIFIGVSSKSISGTKQTFKSMLIIFNNIMKR